MKNPGSALVSSAGLRVLAETNFLNRASSRCVNSNQCDPSGKFVSAGTPKPALPGFLRHALLLLALATTALAAPVEKLADFELTDQDAKPRAYRFPKAKITVMTVADHKGSDQLAPWIQPLHDRYEKRIEIDGVADVSMIPKPFHNMFREAFRKKLTRSVLLDWGGSVVKQFDYAKGVANLYVIDRTGRIVKRVSGPATEDALLALTREIDRAIAKSP